MTHCTATTRRWTAPRHAAPSRPASHPATSHPADGGRAWLRNAMAALALLAAAAAVVSWDAQYVMVRQARHVPVDRRARSGHPRHRRAHLRRPRHRARAARPARAATAHSQRRLRRSFSDHERDSGRAGLAGHGDLGDARSGVRAGQRHPDRRRPRLGAGAHARHRSGARRRRNHPARRRRRHGAVAATAGPGARQHADRVPPLDRRGMPRRSRPQSTRPRRLRHRSRCRQQNCPRSRQAGAAATASRTSRTC